MHISKPRGPICKLLKHQRVYIEALLFYWEVGIGCGPIKERRVVSWYRIPLLLGFKVQHGRSLSGKPRAAGIGGVLLSTSGKFLLMFFKCVGVHDLIPLKRRC